MRITRKGFTLVELLIVIAIVGALSAVAMYNMSGAVGRAKAATIRATFDMCRTAAVQYYASHITEDLSAKTAGDFLPTSLIGWNTTNNKLEKGGITYTVDTTGEAEGKGPTNWKVKAQFPATDTEGNKIIAEALTGVEDITLDGTASATFTLIPSLTAGTVTP